MINIYMMIKTNVKLNKLYITIKNWKQKQIKIMSLASFELAISRAKTQHSAHWA